MRPPMKRTVLLLFSVLALLSASFARVTRIEIKSRVVVANGHSFGLAGPYEKIEAKVFFAVDPKNLHNRQIVDLDLAPRNAHGEVEFSADLFLLRPVNMAKGNSTLLLEIPNRGGRGSILRIVEGANAALSSTKDFGDGFLLNNGYTLAWLGWQWDVPEKPDVVRLYAPIARGPNGPITGLVRTDYAASEPTKEIPLGHVIVGTVGGTSYPVSDPASPLNVLTVRDSPLGQRQVIPRSEWSFSREVDGKLVPDNRTLHLAKGFEPGRIYELVYVAENPVVSGLGLAAVRDFVSWEKYDSAAVAPVKYAISLGISQSARFLRHFVWQGFNADEDGRQVLDGVMPHVAGAGRGSFNHRFAQASRDAQPFNTLFYPTDLFPFTDLPETDPLTGQTAGLLDQALASKTAPKIFYSNTSYEYWGRAASLIHTSADGTKDAKIPDNVRIYFLAGLEHFSVPFPPQQMNLPDLRGQNLPNPNPVQWLWRALITDMREWVVDGTAPPPSTYPHLADGGLVPLDKLAFPKIPGVNLPHEFNHAYHVDYGPEWWTKGIITKEPPVVGQPFVNFVPQVDADGNDRGGVRIPEMAVPLATYTGWNLRSPSIGAPTFRLSFLGSFIPFARTRDEREKNNDPRLSIAERYHDRAQYLGLYTESALELVKQRFLLPQDLPAVVMRGEREWNDLAK